MKPPAASSAGARQWAGLAVLALPTALLGLDVTVLYLAFPAIAADLRPSSTQALWIMDAYGFMIAGFLITMGTLGDRSGRRRLLMIGASAFGLVSILAAFSTSAPMLIAARAALGVAGAALMPSTLALISSLFADPRQRALAIGIWATMFALGMAAGPLVGGILLDAFWWGAAFLVAVPLIALLLVTAPLLLPEPQVAQQGRLDLVSVLLSLAAILPAIHGIKDIAKDGPAAGSLLALAAGIGFAVVFVRRQRSLASPLLDMGLFANRTFSAALVILLLGLVGVGGIMLLVTQHLQFVAGLSPLAAGAAMAPPALAMFVAATAAPLVARRVRPGLVVAAALALSCLGYLLLSRVDGGSAILVVLIGFSLVYFGLGALAALGTDLVVSSAPADRAGSASAMSETVQELGIAVGVATLGSLANAVYRNHMLDRLPGGLPDAVARAVGESLWGAASVAHRIPGSLLEQARAAFVQGFNASAMVGGICILVLAILCAAALRRIGPIGGEEQKDAAGSQK